MTNIGIDIRNNISNPMTNIGMTLGIMSVIQ